MATTQLDVVLKARDEASGKLNDVKQSATGLNKTFLALGGVVAGAMAVGKIVEFGKKSVEAFIDAERASRQLEYAVVQISKGTKEQANAISDLTDVLQKKAGIDGDALKIGAAQLSTFGLQSKSVVDLTKSLADLTVNQKGVNATADDFTQSANTIAKALRGQFGVLEKSGIRFTEAQQAMIMYGNEAEKVAALQEGLNQNLKETTDTIGSSAEGAMARLRAAYGEIQEATGSLIVPALAAIATAFVPIVQGIESFVAGLRGIGESGNAFTEFFAQLEAQTGLVTLFKDAWDNLVFVFTERLKPAIDEFLLAIQPYKPFLEALVQVFGTMLVIAIGAFIMILGSLAIALTELLTIGLKVSTWLHENLTAYFHEVQGGIELVVEWVEKLISALKKLNLVEGAKNVGKAVAGAISGKKAHGGAVFAGSTYQVGENGPETFTPSMSGSIIPNGGGQSGMTLIVNMNGGTYLSEGVAQDIGDMILHGLKRKARIGI